MVKVNGRAKVQMQNSDGNTLIINLEDYISNEVMDFCTEIM